MSIPASCKGGSEEEYEGLTLVRFHWLKVLWLVRFYWLKVRWFERRLRWRANRRVIELRSLPKTVRALTGFSQASAFSLGLALGAVLIPLVVQQRQAPEQRAHVVSTRQVAAAPAHHETNGERTEGALAPSAPDGSDVRRALGALADLEDLLGRHSAEAATEQGAAFTDAEIRDETEYVGDRLAKAPRDTTVRPTVSGAGVLHTDVASTEQGPPAEGGVAAPPKRTHVAGLPIPPRPQWLRNAIRTPVPGEAPMIAVIMDDAGVNQRRTYDAVRLPGPLTIAFIPYGFDLKTHVAVARRHGHEIMVHVPMEPIDPGANPGPNALLTGLEPDEILRRLRWNLAQFDGYVGISNHMGSRFTVWEEGMRLVMAEVRRRGLLFVDSWTHNRSLGMSLSRRFRVPNAARDIFIDHDITETTIRHRLGLLEKIARRRGYAVGIAHPYAVSIKILEEWAGSVQARGYRLVPVSAIVRHRLERR